MSRAVSLINSQFYMDNEADITALAQGAGIGNPVAVQLNGMVSCKSVDVAQVYGANVFVVDRWGVDESDSEYRARLKVDFVQAVADVQSGGLDGIYFFCEYERNAMMRLAEWPALNL